MRTLCTLALTFVLACSSDPSASPPQSSDAGELATDAIDAIAPADAPLPDTAIDTPVMDRDPCDDAACPLGTRCVTRGGMALCEARDAGMDAGAEVMDAVDAGGDASRDAGEEEACVVDAETRWGGRCSCGWADCNGSITDGCEVRLDTNPADCGECGNACSLFRSGPICRRGMCVIGACETGWEDCDRNPATGCESRLASDVNNCGFCHNVCNPRWWCRDGRCLPP